MEGSVFFTTGSSFNCDRPIRCGSFSNMSILCIIVSNIFMIVSLKNIIQHFSLRLSYIKTIFSSKFIIPYAMMLLYTNRDKDLNTGFYADLDSNFQEACEMCDKDFLHEDLISMLKNGNIPQKQIAALKLDGVLSSEDAYVLVSNLTGCDGKIREAVALKIYQILSADNASKIFFNYPKIFASATIDINANICRLVVDSALLLRDIDDFSRVYTDEILKFIFEAFKELDSFVFRDKKYVINKQLFKLYWCLETLKNFYSYVEENTLLDILYKASEQKEYTIREKTAQILLLSRKFKGLQEKLSQDDNYYVRAVFLNH